MILINEVSGNVLFKGNLKVSGAIISKHIQLTGNVINGGTRSFPAYTGEYTITPTNEQQLLLTKDTRMEDNVVVEPIPSNYGVITWNGSFLTVS